jgi:hypothetical protein
MITICSILNKELHVEACDLSAGSHAQQALNGCKAVGFINIKIMFTNRRLKLQPRRQQVDYYGTIYFYV